MHTLTRPKVIITLPSLLLVVPIIVCSRREHCREHTKRATLHAKSLFTKRYDNSSTNTLVSSHHPGISFQQHLTVREYNYSYMLIITAFGNIYQICTKYFTLTERCWVKCAQIQKSKTRCKQEVNSCGKHSPIPIACVSQECKKAFLTNLVALEEH